MLRCACAAVFASREMPVVKRLGRAGIPQARAADLAMHVLGAFERALVLGRTAHETRPPEVTGGMSRTLPAEPA